MCPVDMQRDITDWKHRSEYPVFKNGLGVSLRLGSIHELRLMVELHLTEHADVELTRESVNAIMAGCAKKD